MSDYYVSNSGDDDNIGSESAPWQTIAKVNASSFAAGDNIYFNKGDTWYEELVIPSSGVSGSPITIGSYGSGAAPIIDGSSAATTWAATAHAEVFSKEFAGPPAVVLEGSTLLTFVPWDTNLATTYAAMSASTWTFNGNTAYAWCSDDADPDTHSMRVSSTANEDCIQSVDKSYITIDGLQLQHATRDGFISYDSPSTNVSNIIVKNCVITEVGRNGVLISNQNGGDASYNTTDCLVDNNTISYTGSHGISIAYGIEDTIVSNNNISYAGWRIDLGRHGISLYCNVSTNPPDNITINNNTVTYTYQQTDGTEGTGIQLDDYSKNCTVKFNNCNNNEGSGIGINNSQDHDISYCICHTNGVCGVRNNNHTLGTNTFYNILCYGNTAQGFLQRSNSTATCTLRNNIFAENNVEIEVESSGEGNFTSDYNCVYHSAGGTFMDWTGTDYSWADWLTNSSQDANSLNSNPLFVDAANGDFYLKSNSPCIDAGTDVDLTEDYDGNTIIGSPNIGPLSESTVKRATRKIGYKRSAYNAQSADASGAEVIVADPGAGYKIAVEHLHINCAADDTVTLREDSTTILGPITFKAAGEHFWKHQFMKEDGHGSLLLSSNKELQVLTGGSNAVQVYCEYHILKEA